MAVAKSSIHVALASSAGVLIKWSSLASGDNNTYFDVGNKDMSKFIILVASLNSTDVGTTAGRFYIGTSASAASGTSYALTYSARSLARLKVSALAPKVSAKEALCGSSAAATISISVLGPFESARFKDSAGYVKMCKAKGTSDAGRVKVASILIP